jgi:peptide/nickel transport system permease protein
MNMVRFLVRRIITGILVLWLVATGTFFLFFAAIPVQTVARNLAGRAATPAVINQVISYYGLNKPVIVQYGHFLNKLVHGNLGQSFLTQQSVATIIKQDLPPTISLVIGAMLLWLIVGLAVGILSATRARSLFDRFATLGVLTGVSAPTFVVGELLIIFVFVQLQDHGIGFIQTGYNPISQGIVPWLGTMILPWITLAIVQAAVYTRLSRGSLLDTLGEDYIRTARSKGLTERRVLYRHAVRSAMTPVVSQLGIDIGALLGGVLVTEQVFSLHGLGYQIVASIPSGDQPVVIGLVLIAAAFVVAANILVDMSYALLDPRVRIT